MRLGVLVTSFALTLGTLEYVSATDGPNRSLILGTYRAAARIVSTQVIPYACARLPQLGGPCLEPDTPEPLQRSSQWLSRRPPTPTGVWLKN